MNARQIRTRREGLRRKPFAWLKLRSAALFALLAAASGAAAAQGDVGASLAAVGPDQPAPETAGGGASSPLYFGLLRSRDLTFFRLLRLDMRPAHAVAATPGTWGIESSIGYQNTWSLSPAVEDYLKSLPGRRELGPVEAAAIRALPGENYLIDAAFGVADLTFHYRLSEHWGMYAIAGAVKYSGGVGDGAIERFHAGLGFSDFGRPALLRDDVNVIIALADRQAEYFEAPIPGGLLDPTFAIRYSGVVMPRRWNLVLEAAVKVPLSGRRTFLSTGEPDYGLQATLQRLGERNAFYLSASAVYGRSETLSGAGDDDLTPTLVVGWEFRATSRTHFILQAYASAPEREDEATDLGKNKFQASLGVYRRIGRGVVSFGITENLQNLNNTPDIGLQLGFAFSPTIGRLAEPK